MKNPTSRAKLLRTPLAIADASQAFVKFFGGSRQKDRLALSCHVIDAVKAGEYHRVLGYPTSKRRPRQVRDGDIMFISQMTKEPNDHRIFGWATVMSHRDGVDEATKEEIALRPWRKKYGVYVRVAPEGVGAEFLDGRMEDGVSLNELMDTLRHDSFASTQRNAAAGEGNIYPRRSISQKPHILLSEEGFGWLTERLQKAFIKHDQIPLEDIKKSD